MDGLIWRICTGKKKTDLEFPDASLKSRNKKTSVKASVCLLDACQLDVCYMYVNGVFIRKIMETPLLHHSIIGGKKKKGGLFHTGTDCGYRPGQPCHQPAKGTPWHLEARERQPKSSNSLPINYLLTFILGFCCRLTPKKTLSEKAPSRV